MPVSVLSIVVLVCQTRCAEQWWLHNVPSHALSPRSACALVARLSRIQEGPRYLVSVAVLLTELLKLAVCLVLLGVQAARKLSRASLRQLSLRHSLQVASKFVADSLPLAFPALLVRPPLLPAAVPASRARTSPPAHAARSLRTVHGSEPAESVRRHRPGPEGAPPGRGFRPGTDRPGPGPLARAGRSLLRTAHRGHRRPAAAGDVPDGRLSWQASGRVRPRAC